MWLIPLSHSIQNAPFHFGFSILMELAHSTKKECNVKWNRVQFAIVYVVELLNISYTCSKPYIIQIEQTKCIYDKMDNNLMLNVSITIP
jgi:hypothetical protein